MVLEKTLESPLDSKVKSVNPKGKQLWLFIERTDAEAAATILWPPDVKSQRIRKNPDAGKDWIQEETGATEDEMVGWHHWLNAHEFEQTTGDDARQGSLACCSPWGSQRVSGTWQRNWTVTMELTVSPVKSETVNYHFNSFVPGHRNEGDVQGDLGKSHQLCWLLVEVSDDPETCFIAALVSPWESGETEN